MTELSETKYPSPSHEVADRLSQGEVLRPSEVSVIYEKHGYSPLTGFALNGEIQSGRLLRATGVQVEIMRYKARVIYICATLEKPSQLDSVLQQIDQEFQQQLERRRLRRTTRLIP